MNNKISNNQIRDLFNWIDDVPLSRPKKNFSRDFSDGVATAEVIKFYYPKMIDLHNYSPANSKEHKLYNWETLNNKVFSKINLKVSEDQISDIVNCVSGSIEELLIELKSRLNEYSKKHSKIARCSSNNSNITLTNNNSNESLNNSRISTPSNELPSFNKNLTQPQQEFSTTYNISNNNKINNSSSNSEIYNCDDSFKDSHVCCHCHNTLSNDLINKNDNDTINEDIGTNNENRNNNNNSTNNNSNIISKTKKPISNNNNNNTITNEKRKLSLTNSSKSSSKSLTKSKSITQKKSSSKLSTKNKSMTKTISSTTKTKNSSSTNNVKSKQNSNTERKSSKINENKSNPEKIKDSDKISLEKPEIKNDSSSTLNFIKKNHDSLVNELIEKDKLIKDLQETVDILQLKTDKLEQLLVLKDKRIEELVFRLRNHGLL